MSNKKITIFLLLILIVQISFLGTVISKSTKPTVTTTKATGADTTTVTSTKLNQESTKTNYSFNSSNIKINNGYVRDGSNFSKAIDVKENQSINGMLGSSNIATFYRYYAQYPYEYVNITVTGNNPGFKVNLYDQFDTFISSNTSNTANNLTKSLIITSNNATLHNNLRFIGWYYINLSLASGTTPISYQIQVHFLKGDGSSLWSPIIIQPGINAWNGTFQAKENSGIRKSTFYAFYVNLSDPWITFQISNENSVISYVRFYGPQMNYLNFNYGSGTWLATQEGYYYFEVSESSLNGTYLTISLSLSKTTQTLGYRIDQSLEIPRNTGLNDTILKPFSYRYLKLYLFIGENVSVNIGDTSGSKYDVVVYAPWGKGNTIYSYVDWFVTTTSYSKDPINLFNIQNSGYYIFKVTGPVGPYSVHLSFKYQIQQGSSWESAKIIHLETSFTDYHYLFTNNSYYYKIYFTKGESLNISLQSKSINDALVLGKYRQEIGYMNLSSGKDYIVLQNYSDSNYIYIQLNPSSNSSYYSLNVSRITQIIYPTIHIDGTLVTFNSRTLKTEIIPLIKITLMQQIGSNDSILAVTSTNESGYFSLTYTKSLPSITSFYKLFLLVAFDGPALQLMNYNAPTPNEVFASVYSFTINLNTNSLPVIHLGQIYVPSWSYEYAHIFLTVTKGWLWVFNLNIERIPPPQIHYLYSADSPGTIYSPYAVINNKLIKYVVNLLGTNTGDDDGWDDTVILHEYGHHVEETYDLQNNPGGLHYYSSTISPDLAHAEGFPTFFACVVLNTSIYQDTSNNGTTVIVTGINLETGRMITNNQLEDLFGMYGETSVFTLYYGLIDKSKNEDSNYSGFGDSVTIPVKDLFNILFNYRKVNGSGVTTTNDVYQGLIHEFPNLIDNISKAFYAHGNSYYSDPFMVGSTDQIVSASDTNANFTWELYDSNPQSYQIIVDGNVLKTGAWNFTEEVLFLNIHQFNFTVGTTHYFILKLNDTLNNQRVYTFEVKIVSSMSSLGSNYLNSINILASKPVSMNISNTTYFQYIPTESGVINITYSSPGYNFTIYDQNYTLLRSFSQTFSPNKVILEVVNNQAVYFVLTYIGGPNGISLIVDPNPVGYSPQNPLPASTLTAIQEPITSSESTFYVSFKPTYSSRFVSLSLIGTNIHQITIYYQNKSLLANFLIASNKNSFSYLFPLDNSISNTDTFSIFKTYLIVFNSNDNNFKTNISIQSVQTPKMQFIGPFTQIIGTNQSLELNYSGSPLRSFHLLLNNTHYLGNWTIQSRQNGTYSIVIPTVSLSTGLYVIDIVLIDANGLQLYYQFSFTISPKVISHTHLFLLMGIVLTSLLVIGIGGLILFKINRSHERFLSRKIGSFFTKKQK